LFTIAELTEHNNKQTTTDHVENPGQAQICGGVKPVNGTPRKYQVALKTINQTYKEISHLLLFMF
jgi:hypothetical protein